MAASLPETDDLIRAARTTRKILTVHQNWRCSPEFRQIFALLNSGKLGDVFTIQLTQLQFARRNDFQTLRQYADGTLNATTSHCG